MRALRREWMSGSGTTRDAGLESWMMFGLSVVSLVVLLILVIAYYVGG